MSEHQDITLKRIAQSQQDAVLLISFLSERKVRALDDASMKVKKEDLLRVVAMDPQAVLDSPQDWAILIDGVDDLAHRARPATVESIRFTTAYITEKKHGESPGPAYQESVIRSLRFQYRAVRVAGLVVIGVTIMLLNQVLSGQMMIDRLHNLRAEQAELVPRLAQATADLPKTGSKVDKLCGGSDSDGGQGTNVQAAVCHEWADLSTKFDLLYLQFRVWNETVDRAHTPIPIPNWIRPEIQEIFDYKASDAAHRALAASRPQPAEVMVRAAYSAASGSTVIGVVTEAAAEVPSGVTSRAGPEGGTGPDAGLEGSGRSRDDQTVIRVDFDSLKSTKMAEMLDNWRSTELRTEIMLAGLGVYWIPALLGFVGACVFVLRRLHSHLEEWTLEARERLVIVPRVLLGLMLGGLVSLLFEATYESPTNFSFSLSFLAFLTGYSVQAVFDMLDGIIFRSRGGDGGGARA